MKTDSGYPKDCGNLNFVEREKKKTKMKNNILADRKFARSILPDVKPTIAAVLRTC